MRALITGLEGFVGRHLARHLIQEGREVFGTTERSRLAAGWPADLASVGAHRCDVTNLSDVETVMSLVKPDEVYHLAGVSHVPASWDDPEVTLRVNLLGTLHVLDAARDIVPKARVLVVSSGDVYGSVAAHGSPTEDGPAAPASPYAVSKLAADQLAATYAARYRQHIVRMRPYLHTGPGQLPPFVFPSFARRIARAERGLEEPRLLVGNLAIERDVSDVRDIVRAYQLALAKAEPGACFNVGRGETVRLQSVVDTLVERARVKIAVEVDPALVRPEEARASRCDASRLRETTGWKPEIPFEQTLADLLDYWREQP